MSKRVQLLCCLYLECHEMNNAVTENANTETHMYPEIYFSPMEYWFRIEQLMAPLGKQNRCAIPFGMSVGKEIEEIQNERSELFLWGNSGKSC